MPAKKTHDRAALRTRSIRNLDGGRLEEMCRTVQHLWAVQIRHTSKPDPSRIHMGGGPREMRRGGCFESAYKRVNLGRPGRHTSPHCGTGKPASVRLGLVRSVGPDEAFVRTELDRLEQRVGSVRTYSFGTWLPRPAKQECSQCSVSLPQHCLNFFPDPHPHRSLRPTFEARRRTVATPSESTSSSRCDSK
jgi:hypothetical protein